MDCGKRWVTLFFPFSAIHITKDPGMIPKTMHEVYGFRCAVPVEEARMSTQIRKGMLGVETPVVNFGERELSKRVKAFIWLKRNARTIDVLHLYFYGLSTWVLDSAYLRKNKAGLVYVHCDCDGQSFVSNVIEGRWLRPSLVRFVKRILLNQHVRDRTLFGIQQKENAELLAELCPQVNVAHVPNGFSWPDGRCVSFDEKENVILTVARNGSDQKRTDILLEGFARVAERHAEWTLRLVGPIEDSFLPFIKDYYLRYPLLKERVVFVGPINDRAELQIEFSRAKIFCLTSDWEGFGLVLAEAMSMGDFIVGSDLSSTASFLENEQYGLLFKKGSVEDFALKIDEAMSDDVRLRNVCDKAQANARAKYTWKKALAPVNCWIESMHYKTKS